MNLDHLFREQSKKCRTNSGKFYLYNLLSELSDFSYGYKIATPKKVIKRIYKYYKDNAIFIPVVDENVRANLFSLIVAIKEDEHES